MFIGLAVMFGLVSGVLALTKGRSMLGWFIAGAVMGPFAFIVLALPTRPKPGRFDECPVCCEVIRHEALLCRFCGTQFEW